MERRYHMEGAGNVFIETDVTPERMEWLKDIRTRMPRFARRRIKQITQIETRYLKNVMIDRAKTPWWIR